MIDKVIIVTGGSGLLGRAILNDLISKGAIPINFDIVKSDVEANYIKCDITNDKSIKTAIRNVIKKYYKIDGLVNNAYPRTKDWGKHFFEQIKKYSWRKNIDLQLNSYFSITQEVLKIMIKQKYGAIINISSIYGVVGNDFQIYEGTKLIPPAAYAAIKGGLISLTKYLASNYGKNGIRINCVSPGGILDKQPDEFIKAYSKKVPLKRMANPEDIAPGVSFLLSDEAKYITGHNLIIDGGWTII